VDSTSASSTASTSVASTIAMVMGGALVDSVEPPIHRQTTTMSRPTSPRKEEKEVVPSFASMPHLLHMVDNQVETGMAVMKRMRSFLQKFSDMQVKFAAKLEELAKIEKQKLLSKGGTDKMESCWAAVVAFFGQIDTICVTYKEIGENLTMTCVEPLNKYHAVCVQQQKDHHAEIARVTGAYDEVKVDVHKNREVCRNLLQKVVQKKTAYVEGNTIKESNTPKEQKKNWICYVKNHYAKSYTKK